MTGWKEIIVWEFYDAKQNLHGSKYVGELIRCKDCKYYRDGDCWHEWNNDGRMYYQSVINEPNPDDYCSRAERKEE